MFVFVQPRDLQTVIRRSDTAHSSYQNNGMIDERMKTRKNILHSSGQGVKNITGYII